jgi:protein-tyrosine-phosphatase
MAETEKYRVMFVCSGNTCRSPMAEYALRSLLESERPGKTEVFSSGTLGLAGQPATAFAQEAAKIWDLNLLPHSNQPLTAELIRRADLIFAMAPEHFSEVVRLVPGAENKTYLLRAFPDNTPVGERVHDPIGQDLERYNEVFLEIGEHLGKYLPEILKRVDKKLASD